MTLQEEMTTGTNTDTWASLWRRLTPLYDEGEAKAVVRLVLECRFGMSTADIFTDGISKLTNEARDELERIMLRLMQGEPVQYVLGYAEFLGRRFAVGPGVLIPRPETEELCRWIISDNEGGDGGDILDIGTGSGCIAVTLAAELPQAEGTAWDVSPEALRIARENAKRASVLVSFEQVDILNAQSTNLKPQSLDLIVSNPPYVCESERAAMAPNVLEHEPELALFVPDDDPLRFYRAIGSYALQALKPGGHLFFEINERLGSETEDLLAALGFTQILIHKDQFGKDRFISACR